MYSFKKRNGTNKMDSKRVGHEVSIIHEVNDTKGTIRNQLDTQRIIRSRFHVPIQI